MRLVFALAFLCAVSATAQSIRESRNYILAEANSAQQSDDLAVAERNFRRLVDTHPQDAEARLGLGSVLTRQGRYDEAIRQLESGLQSSNSKRRVALLTGLGLAYTDKGNLAAARVPLEEALALQPSNAVAARLLADADLAAGDPEASLAVLTPRAGSAALDPEFGRVFGIALVRSGKVFDGAQALEHSGQVTGNAATLKLSGIAYLDSGENDSARRVLEVARKINPELPEIDALVSIARERCGDRYAAEWIFRERLAKQPEDFDANVELGALLLKRQQAEHAAPYLAHALALQPRNPRALYESALLQLANQQAKLAAESLRQACAEDRAWAAPHLQLAILDDNEHRMQEAATERKLAASLAAAQSHTGAIPPVLP